MSLKRKKNLSVVVFHVKIVYKAHYNVFRKVFTHKNIHEREEMTRDERWKKFVCASTNITIYVNFYAWKYLKIYTEESISLEWIRKFSHFKDICRGVKRKTFGIFLTLTKDAWKFLRTRKLIGHDMSFNFSKYYKNINYLYFKDIQFKLFGCAEVEAYLLSHAKCWERWFCENPNRAVFVQEVMYF